MQKNNFLLLKKFKNTESAQLWSVVILQCSSKGLPCPKARTQSGVSHFSRPLNSQKAQL